MKSANQVLNELLSQSEQNQPGKPAVFIKPNGCGENVRQLTFNEQGQVTIIRQDGTEAKVYRSQLITQEDQREAVEMAGRFFRKQTA